MITAAAICPAPPLLARELTGGDPAVPELRRACLDAATALLRQDPDLVAVVGVAPQTRVWPGDTPWDLSVYAPGVRQLPRGRPARSGAAASHTATGNDAASHTATGNAAAGNTAAGADAGDAAGDLGSLPLPLGLGGRLLDQAGYAGHRLLQAVAEDEPPGACAALGAKLAAAGRRVALLVLADGSARRGLRAPGYLDERSFVLDGEVERAVRDGDVAALLAIDPSLARELMATGRAAWQVLAGAMNGEYASSEVRYCDDPFGVAYLVASLHHAEAPLDG